MSRKTVQINVPAPAAPVAAPAIATKPASYAPVQVTMDSWIAQAKEATEALGAKLDAKIDESLGEAAFAGGRTPGKSVSVKVELSTEPSFADAAKIFFFLPQAALWFWSVGLARRALNGYQYWHR